MASVILDVSDAQSPNRRPLQRSELSWTDDLPQCKLSDVGVACNVTYLDDGSVSETYPYEDRVFNFATDNDCYLYGLFDGHDGSRAAHFASERLPAELLLGQLNPGRDDDITVKNILSQAYSIVERGFFESIDIELAQKTHLQSQLPERLPPDLAEKHYPTVIQKIRALNDSIKGGTTAVVALVLDDKLYVANVGDSRALLCQVDSDHKLKVEQLTGNHDVYDETELSRLKEAGLNVEKLIEMVQKGLHECTRCIGDYTVKGGYRENELLRDATSEPIIATPDIYGGFPLCEMKDGFLVMMSDDVYKCLEQATGTTQANKDVASMISHELHCRNSVQGAAQNVVDKISFLHRKAFAQLHHCSSRGDLTLLVRNFSHPIGTDALPELTHLPDMSGRHPVSIPYIKHQSLEFHCSDDNSSAECQGASPLNSSKPSVTLSLVIPQQKSGGDQVAVEPEMVSTTSRSATNRSETSTSSEDTPTNVASYNHLVTATTSSFSDPDVFYRTDRHQPLELDTEKKIAPYVSFACFDMDAWNATRSGLLRL